MDMIKETTFHIGGPKTGSTAIQVWLARNREFLKENQLDYPADASDQKAIENKIISGNGQRWATAPSSMRLMPGHLWSNEHLFFSNPFKEFLAERSQDSDTPINIVGYYRDPVPWAVSRWMQSLKREGGSIGLDEFLKENGVFLLKHLLSWLELPNKIPISVRLYNYENHKHSLIEHFVKNILGTDYESPPIEQKTSPRVNRGLTTAEAAMLVEINKATAGDPAIARKVSDSLVEKLPLIETGHPVMSEKALREFGKTSNSIVKQINKLVDHEERITLIDKVPIFPRDMKPSNLPIAWFEEMGRLIGSFPRN